jgi:hypothetical protein
MFASQGALPVSMTLVANLPSVSKTPAVNLSPVPLVSLVPMANMPPVSTTPLANCQRYHRTRKLIHEEKRRSIKSRGTVPLSVVTLFPLSLSQLNI